MVDNQRLIFSHLALFNTLLLLIATELADGTSAIYDGGAGCSGYGFHMEAFWLDCEGGLCALEDGAMRVLGNFTTEYQMPWAYYTLKMKACKWYGMRCIDVGSKFEVDLCEYVDCRIGNHSVDQEIIFYGEEEQQFDYWQNKYGYGVDADEEERANYKKPETETPTEVPTEEETELNYWYGRTRNHNYFRNKYAYKRQQRQEAYEEKTGRTIAKDLTEFASEGTVVTISFTFIPYTEASYDKKWGWNSNHTAQGYYHQKYGKQYRYDNLYCNLPLKIVSDDFDVALWQKSSRYRARLRTYETAMTMAIVGMLGFSVWGMKKRRLVCRRPTCGCLEDTEDEDNSLRADDTKTTDFVLADDCDSHSLQHL